MSALACRISQAGMVCQSASSHIREPVRPLVAMFYPMLIMVIEDASPDADGDAEAVRDDAVFEEPIIGEHEDSDAELDPTPLCQPCTDQEELIDHSPAGLPCPQEFTKKDWQKHCLTHLPYHAGCPFCVQGKRPNSPRLYAVFLTYPQTTDSCVMQIPRTSFRSLLSGLSRSNFSLPPSLILRGQTQRMFAD